MRFRFTVEADVPGEDGAQPADDYSVRVKSRTDSYHDPVNVRIVALEPADDHESDAADQAAGAIFDAMISGSSVWDELGGPSAQLTQFTGDGRFEIRLPGVSVTVRGRPE